MLLDRVWVNIWKESVVANFALLVSARFPSEGRFSIAALSLDYK